jgi:3-hydroxybutyryl-CoA dehydrogenase
MSLPADIKDRALENIKTSTSLKTGLIDAELIVEAATENIDLKLKIFKDLDAFANPGVILASILHPYP